MITFEVKFSELSNLCATVRCSCICHVFLVTNVGKNGLHVLNHKCVYLTFMISVALLAKIKLDRREENVDDYALNEQVYPLSMSSC